MSRSIFISLPVADVAKSRAFYQGLGWPLNADYSTEESGCFSLSDTINIMVMTHERFREFSVKPMVHPSTGAMSLVAISCESRAEVDGLAEAAVRLGGRSLHPAEDLGFMYSCAFEDPDGNGFGPFWMNPNAG